jgi:hypothetical protein
MKHKMILLALGALCAAMLALPAMASAAGWDIDPESGKLPLKFTSAGGEAKLTRLNGQKVTCTANSGTGQYETATTGKIELTFTGCKDNLGFTCTTAGQAAGTITTTELEFHNIMIDSTAQVVGGKPGVLITPNAGHFATFACTLGIGTVVVSGNGIVGEVSNPTCTNNPFQKTATLNFESSATGTQKYMQEETAGTKFDLLSSTNGALAETSSEDAEGTVTFAENAKMTCP